MSFGRLIPPSGRLAEKFIADDGSVWTLTMTRLA